MKRFNFTQLQQKIVSEKNDWTKGNVDNGNTERLWKTFSYLMPLSLAVGYGMDGEAEADGTLALG
jgi:hypothetical protein